MIRVLIADDHRVVRMALEQLLSMAEDVELVGSAADGDEAASLARARTPDVVLMDLSMPGLDGIEATKRILSELPGTRILVFTSFSDRESIRRAIDAGAIGYLPKDTEPSELLAGIRAAARGESRGPGARPPGPRPREPA